MKKNAQWQHTLFELKEFKKELKSEIGKYKKFTVGDLELYVKKKYDEEFFNSLEELYDKRRNLNIYGNDITDYIDCLGYNIISKKYKVAEISKNIDGKTRSALLFYSYDGEIISEIYLEGDPIEKLGFFGIFEQNGEKKMRKALKRWYGMSERKAKRLVKKLE